MRIDRLELVNFKKFVNRTFEFTQPDGTSPGKGAFRVFIGANGSGKTSLLDAAAVALGVWLERVPDSLLASSRRRLTRDQKRLKAVTTGDRTQLQEVPGDMAVRAAGSLLGHPGVTWGQTLPAGRRRVSNRESGGVLDLIADAYDRVRGGENVLLPVISYYGAGRAWLPHNERARARARVNGPANRWEAFYDCLNDRIRLGDLNGWFRTEAIARGARGGRYRPGFDVVLRAVRAAVPGADGLEYDADREQVILSLDGNPQPFNNLSAGQRAFFALVADIAVKMVTQNNFLVPPDALGPDDDPLPRVLKDTPGVVLIDELDVHLHPQWQREIPARLRATFPSLQFLTTTHSPQVLGGVQPYEILRLLADGSYDVPAQSYGMDTNWVLQALMDADEQLPAVKRSLADIFRLIADRRLADAEQQVLALRRRIGNSEGLQRAASTIERIRMLGR